MVQTVLQVVREILVYSLRCRVVLVNLARVAMSCLVGRSRLVVLGLVVSMDLDQIRRWLPRKVWIGSVVDAA